MKLRIFVRTGMSLIFVVAATLVSGQRVDADTITIDAEARGLIDNFNNRDPFDSPQNVVLTGNCLCVGDEHRNWFRFQIPELNGPVESAEFVIDSGLVRLAQEPTTEYLLTSLNAGFRFRNLGMGQEYARRSYTGADNETTIAIDLNQTAIDAITESQSGEPFLLGGRLSMGATFDATLNSQFLFGGITSATQLRITTVPEPPSMPFASLLLGFSLFFRQRSARFRIGLPLV